MPDTVREGLEDRGRQGPSCTILDTCLFLPLGLPICKRECPPLSPSVRSEGEGIRCEAGAPDASPP